jgi:hypothetical protein
LTGVAEFFRRYFKLKLVAFWSDHTRKPSKTKNAKL